VKARGERRYREEQEPYEEPSAEDVYFLWMGCMHGSACWGLGLFGVRVAGFIDARTSSAQAFITAGV